MGFELAIQKAVSRLKFSDFTMTTCNLDAMQNWIGKFDFMQQANMVEEEERTEGCNERAKRKYESWSNLVCYYWWIMSIHIYSVPKLDRVGRYYKQNIAIELLTIRLISIHGFDIDSYLRCACIFHDIMTTFNSLIMVLYEQIENSNGVYRWILGGQWVDPINTERHFPLPI